jgi:isopenicillin-N N-acyltransferase-like protein
MKNINRRNFIKNILGTAALCSVTPNLASAVKKKPAIQFYPATNKSFPMLDVSGSYYDIGYAIGKTFGDSIHRIFRRRADWFKRLKDFAKADPDRYAEKLKIEAKKYYPNLFEELRGIADGARLPFDDIFLLNIKAEINAKMTITERVSQDTPGCSTIYLIRDDKKLILHNEDGNAAYKDVMFMLKATPPSGITFLVLTYPGIFAGNGPGMNSHGITQTTNYIASMKWKIGIPRYFLNRAVLEARTLKEAVNIITHPKRAFAYHHNLSSFKTGEALSVEVTPDDYSIYKPRGIYFHTNHHILEGTKELEQDMSYVNSSSMSRYRVIAEEVNELNTLKDVTEKDLLGILSSHKNAPYSPCRHPKGEVKGTTLATAVIDITDASMKIYKGNPCEASKSERLIKYYLN